MAPIPDNQSWRTTLFRIGRILLVGGAAVAALTLFVTTPPDELFSRLAQAAGIAVACGISQLVITLRTKVGLSWRTILGGAAKGLVVLVVGVEVLAGLVDPSAGPAGRTTAFLVIALCCASLAYLFFVSSRVHLRLSGIEGQIARLKDDAGGTDASDEEITIQVTRLSAQASQAAVVNEAPLPVLRAQTSVATAHVTEGGQAVASQVPQLSMGPAFSLGARSTRREGMARAFDHVGIFRLQSTGVRVYSPFGLLSRTVGTPGQWRVRVVPNIYRIPYGIPRTRAVMQGSLGLPDSPADALDYDRVRDYRPGDPLKTIHWKLVAHSQGELYTKLFETPTITGVTLTIGSFGPDIAASDAESAFHLHDTMLEGAFSLIEHARENGIAGRLRFVRRDGLLVEAPWTGPGLRGWFVETAHRPTRSHEDATRCITAIQAMRNAREGYAIFATSALTETAVEELIACHHAGVAALVVHALPISGGEATRQRTLDERLRAASITVIALTDGSQIVREVESA